MSSLSKFTNPLFSSDSPTYLRVLFKQSLDSINKKDYSNAWKYINRASQLNLLSVEALFLKGYVLEKMECNKQAINYYDQTLKRQPNYKKALSAYLSLALKEGLPLTEIIIFRAKELLLQAQFKNEYEIKLAYTILKKVPQQRYIGAIWKHKNQMVGWVRDMSQKNNGILIHYEIDRRIETFLVKQKKHKVLQKVIGEGGYQFRIEIKNIQSNSLFYFPDGSYIPGSPIRLKSKNSHEEKKCPGKIVSNQKKDKWHQLNNSSNNKIINLIIPVYKHLESLCQCIDSVINSKNCLKYEIIVINDASPDPHICDYLNSLNKQKKISLITNSVNLGFVKSVNKGMFYRQDRDCVLLNSDTIVFHDWLDRMHKIAYTDEKIATVTPFSNNSELTSFPLIHQNSSMISIEKLKHTDEIAARVNLNQFLDIPSGVGFCFYIKRNCLEQCGGLNETDILRGYGDEAEFCLRINKLGWRNVCATNVYVAHEGGKSFNHEKRKLALDNMSVLEKMYPEYKDSYRHFIRSDPLREYKYKIELEQLSDYPKCSKLLILGYNQQVLEDELFVSLKAQQSVYWLRPEYLHDGLKIRLGRDKELTPANFLYHFPADKERLINDLRCLGVPHIEFKELRFETSFFIKLPSWLNCSYSIYPNDFSLICSHGYLLNREGEFCGGPEEKKCTQCTGLKRQFGVEKTATTSTHPMLKKPDEFLNIAPLFSEFLSGADEFKVDSLDSLNLFQAVYPHLSITLNRVTIRALRNGIAMPANEYVRKKAPRSVVKIAIPHSVNHSAGYGFLFKMAQYACQTDLPVEFLVFGETINTAALQASGKVFVSSTLKQEDFQYLKTRYDCRMAVFLHQWPVPILPELQYCCENKIAVGAFDLGVFKEYLSDSPEFLLFPLDANIAKICTYLMKWSFNDS